MIFFEGWNWVDFFATMASITTVGGFLPQIFKNHKTKSAAHLSLLMILNFILCSTMWIIYGILLEARAIWITNFMALITNFWLLIQWFYYKYYYRENFSSDKK